MADKDQNQTGPDSLPTEPSGETSDDSLSTVPLNAEATSSTLPAAPPPATVVAGAPAPGAAPTQRGLLERTWVRVTAAVVAAVILVGGGVGVGLAVADQSNDSGRSAIEGEPGGGEDVTKDRHDDGSRQEHDRRDKGGDPEGDDGDSDSTPTPAPTPSTP